MFLCTHSTVPQRTGPGHDNGLIINDTEEENHRLHYPTPQEQGKYGVEYDFDENEWINTENRANGWLSALIDEVVDNGFKEDLCLQCGKYDECKHDVYTSQYSILRIVDEKIKCNRHILMSTPLEYHRDYMLALVLYTSMPSSISPSKHIIGLEKNFQIKFICLSVSAVPELEITFLIPDA